MLLLIIQCISYAPLTNINFGLVEEHIYPISHGEWMGSRPGAFWEQVEGGQGTACPRSIRALVESRVKGQRTCCTTLPIFPDLQFKGHCFYMSVPVAQW